MKLRLIITDAVQQKLTDKHRVTRTEVVQCFANKKGRMLGDNREDHQTDPPTRWFVADTDAGRALKVIFVRDGGMVFLKSAFEPNEEELRIYSKYGL